MTDFKKGDIVRRKSGWTPIVVLKTPPDGPNARVLTAYCNSYHNAPGYYGIGGHAHSYGDLRQKSRLTLITSEKEIEKCRNWKQRLTHEQHETLLRQFANETNQEENTMNKLYETKEETPRFGTYLAINSAGRLVLEMKGTGNVETFDKKDVEEVKPYTVRVRYGTQNNGSKGYEFFAKKGEVSVGDLLYLTDYKEFAVVDAVDTKSNRATKNLHGRRVLSEPFGSSED